MHPQSALILALALAASAAPNPQPTSIQVQITLPPSGTIWRQNTDPTAEPEAFIVVQNIPGQDEEDWEPIAWKRVEEPNAIQGLTIIEPPPMATETGWETIWLTILTFETAAPEPILIAPDAGFQWPGGKEVRTAYWKPDAHSWIRRESEATPTGPAK